MKLTDISQARQERLSHIDFKAFFFGIVGRIDLVSRFGIKEASATRDIAFYRELAPGNLEYDTKSKAYVIKPGFTSMFEYSPPQVLAALSYGFGKDFVGIHKTVVPCEMPANLNHPKLSVLAVLTRAIHQGKAVRIHYRSIESGPGQCEIVPFVLVDNGLRWHVRAYCRKRQAFTDFVITRISEPKLIKGELQEHETREADIQWNRIVEMEIVPHPELPYPETIEADYGMRVGALKINVRAAVAGYVLRRWNVDCTEDHCLKGAEYQLWLRNRAALYGVENLILAPGYDG
ncbi:MAG: WYL domain-containing protein [Gammaproteobacteria bacterium]|nr:WYL domain-containing protein [Gammaproteobacteria bacterium]